LQLGAASTSYSDEYDPSLLRPIERSLGRATLRMREFKGFDLWRMYEITCLDRRGVPMALCGTLRVDASSPRIIESKSLKLYLLSFTMTRFASKEEVASVIAHDLFAELKSQVEVEIFTDEECPFVPERKEGILIDGLDPGEAGFSYNPSLLRTEAGDASETLRSNILRTLCPVTGQPDHAEVFISYEGPKISREGLLAYLISLRTHRGFHEQCCELIYSDIMTRLAPSSLCVRCAFTRRGGIDINPVRTSGPEAKAPRSLRQ
ncbi:MAG: NADPH-dependent 7-cyano-7-deazaguanine reductase QueF, partial [Succinivibrio sp.]